MSLLSFFFKFLHFTFFRSYYTSIPLRVHIFTSSHYAARSILRSLLLDLPSFKTPPIFVSLIIPSSLLHFFLSFLTLSFLLFSFHLLFFFPRHYLLLWLCKILEAVRSNIDISEIIGSNTYDFERVSQSAAWVKAINGDEEHMLVWLLRCLSS